MKLQPRLRMTSQDWDFTKDTLDLNLLRDMRKRNKKEESDRLMQTVSIQQEAPKVMLLSTTKSVRDSQNSQAQEISTMIPNSPIIVINNLKESGGKLKTS